MKMKKENKKQSKAAVSSKRGKLAAAACVMALALGAAGFFAFTGESIQTTDNSEAQTTTTTTSAPVTTTTTAADTQTQTATGQIVWRKAGISEYEVANAKQTVTTTTTTSQTTTTTTTSAPKQTTTKAAVTTAKPAVTTTAKPATTTTVKTTAKPAATTKAAAANKTVHHSASENIKYTAEEFDMMCYVVQAEVGNCYEPYKIAVANVIINRVKSSRFAYATNIKAVLTAGGQFDSISNYYSKRNPPNQSTINCCKRALAGEDNSNGAVYYYSPKICGTIAWFESMQCCLYLDSGIYSAKFFKPW